MTRSSALATAARFLADAGHLALLGYDHADNLPFGPSDSESLRTDPGVIDAVVDVIRADKQRRTDAETRRPGRPFAFATVLSDMEAHAAEDWAEQQARDAAERAARVALVEAVASIYLASEVAA